MSEHPEPEDSSSIPDLNVVASPLKHRSLKHLPYIYSRFLLTKENDKHQKISSLKMPKVKYSLLPKQVMYDSSRSKLVKKLCLMVADKFPSQEFAIEDIVIEYKPHLIGVKEKFKFGKKRYRYTYLETYVPFYMPTDRYGWFIKEASDLIKQEVRYNSVHQNPNYTYLIAEIDTNKNVECYAYSDELEELRFIGYLYKVMDVLESDVIGVGYFEVSVYNSRDFNINFLKFTLTKFQLVNKTSKSGASMHAIKMEPPAEVMEKLHDHH